LWGGTMRDIVL